MPALPNVAKVVRVQFLLSGLGNTRVQDRIYLAFAGAGPAVADLNTLGATIATAWGTNLSSAMSTAGALIGVALTDLTSATGAQTQVSTSKIGTGGAVSLPNGTAAVIRFKIARRYRGGHPRFYFPFPPQAQEGAGPGWLSTYVSSLAASFLAFITAVETTPPVALGALTHVNVSYFSGFTNKSFPSGRTHPVPTLRATPLQDLVVSYSVNPNYGSQRRRNLQSA
jgi:hypothetical protein